MGEPGIEAGRLRARRHLDASCFLVSQRALQKVLDFGVQGMFQGGAELSEDIRDQAGQYPGYRCDSGHLEVKPIAVHDLREGQRALVGVVVDDSRDVRDQLVHMGQGGRHMQLVVR
ncbi:hypothetical protein ACWGND_19610 [Streptomyces althioticus]